MADFGDLALEQWKLAMMQADGHGESVVSILATALGLAAAEANIPIDKVLARVRHDHEMFVSVQAEGSGT